MREFVRVGYSKDKLLRLNQVTLHMQVLFLSDILGASGKDLDRRYLARRRLEMKWSSINFPKEKPPNKDFTLWVEALHNVVPAGGIQDRLGRLMHGG